MPTIPYTFTPVSASYWIDTHAHIYLDAFDGDLGTVLKRCDMSGVRKIIMPNIDRSSVERLHRVEGDYADTCFPMMGLHPCSVKPGFERELKVIEDWLTRHKYFAIGEMGTDLYWDKQYWEEQKEAFLIQAGWAKTHDLPLAIHCRESLDPTIELIEREQDGKLRGVFHCFTGTLEQAKRIMQAGFHLGIGGVATFKNSGMNEVLEEVNLDHIVLETDSPYLAPVPYRGKRNEPSYIPLIGKHLAKVRGVPVADVQQATTLNARNLFRI